MSESIDWYEAAPAFQAKASNGTSRKCTNCGQPRPCWCNPAEPVTSDGKWAAQNPPWETGTLPDDDSLTDEHGFVDWAKAFGAAPAQISWIVEPFLRKGMTHSLFGVPGHGKSLFVIETMVNHVIAGHRVVYLDNENHLLEEIIPRLKSFGCTPADLDNFKMLSFERIPPLDTPAGGQYVLDKARVAGAVLVVMDTTSRFIDGPEDKSDTFTSFYNHTLMPLKAASIATLRLDHPGKDVTRGARGTSAKYGDIDLEFRIEDPEDGRTPYRRLVCTKARGRGGMKLGEVIMLRKCEITADNPSFYHEWVYEPGRDVSLATSGRADDDAALLDSIGLPLDAGRRRARGLLVDKGIEMGNTRLDAALKARREGSRDVPGDVPRPHAS